MARGGIYLPYFRMPYSTSHNFRATHRGKGSFLYFDLHVDLRDPVDLAPKGMNPSKELAPNGYYAAY